MHEPSTITSLCIYACPDHVCVCVCVYVRVCVCGCVHACTSSNSIRAKRTFHCSHRTITEPSNGTCCIRSQRRTACGLLGIIHADITRRKTCRGPKQTAPLNPLQLQTSTVEQSEGLVADLIMFHHFITR